MKILLQNTLFFPHVIGGAEISTHLLGEELRRRGLKVDAVASTGRQGHGHTLTTRPTADGLGTIYEAPAHGLCDPFPAEGDSGRPNQLIRGLNHLAGVYSPRWKGLFLAILDRTRPDIVHTNTLVGMTPSILAAAHARRIPVVHTLRDYHLLCPRTTLLRSDQTDCLHPPLPCRLLSRWKMHFTAKVDAVTGPSRFVLEKHLAGGGFAHVRTFVVPNALEDLPHEIPTRLPDGPVRGLFMGQISNHKGIALLLEILPRLFADPRCDDLRFDFAGRGPQAGKVAEFCSTYPDRARFHGHVTGAAKANLLKRASFVTVPSLWSEPFGRSIIDGFSWGLPVLGSNRGGIPEIITDGAEGRIIPPEPDAWITAIRELTVDHDLRLQMGAAARRRAADFTLSRQADSFLSIYDSLSAKRHDHE